MRGAPYALGTEPGTGPEGGAGIEGCADDSGVGVLEIVVMGQPHEGAHAGEARRLEGVRRLVAYYEVFVCAQVMLL